MKRFSVVYSNSRSLSPTAPTTNWVVEDAHRPASDDGTGHQCALRDNEYIDRIAIFTAASETFNEKNINATIDESFERFAPVMRRARATGIPVRGYVSTSFWCPYEGRVAPEKTAEVVARLFDIGTEEISVGDTTGKAVPDEVHGLLDLLLDRVPAERLAMHFHDTFGHAVENVRAAVERGVEIFDSSAGGIGGCPYSPGASGNIATEALAATLRGAGAEVKLDLAALSAAHAIITDRLGLPRLTAKRSI